MQHAIMKDASFYKFIVLVIMKSQPRPLHILTKQKILTVTEWQTNWVSAIFGLQETTPHWILPAIVQRLSDLAINTNIHSSISLNPNQLTMCTTDDYRMACGCWHDERMMEATRRYCHRGCFEPKPKHSPSRQQCLMCYNQDQPRQQTTRKKKSSWCSMM